MYFVYILECCDGTFYTGITTDIKRRLRQHNGEITGGAKYTCARQPVKLIAQSTALENRSLASKLEYLVKKKKKEDKVCFLTNFKNFKHS
ncbi:MAG: GIY-YIG nuclease family protein [Lentisphaeraceae bacterium]|nr:GIY-YIG nuclease family protein [Lentisphaeraceae bacterium]